MQPLCTAATLALLQAVNANPVNLARQANTIDYNAAPPNLSTLADGSLFETWRSAVVLAGDRSLAN